MKGSVVTYFKALSQHSIGGTYDNQAVSRESNTGPSVYEEGAC
jgi:hypothetical protein